MSYSLHYDMGKPKKRMNHQWLPAVSVFALAVAVCVRLWYPQSAFVLRQLLMQPEAVVAFATQTWSNSDAYNVVMTFCEGVLP